MDDDPYYFYIKMVILVVNDEIVKHAGAMMTNMMYFVADFVNNK